MASFETDLARYLAEQDRLIAIGEREQREWDELHMTYPEQPWLGEDSPFVSAHDVKDAEVPGPVRRYGSDDPGRVVPGCWD